MIFVDSLWFLRAPRRAPIWEPRISAGGRIFATLAHVDKGYGNLMLSAEEQAAFVGERPDVFLPVAGGWGRNGATHVWLATVTEDVLAGALHTAWKLRLEKNGKTVKKKTKSKTS
jgi:hypothetical protein